VDSDFHPRVATLHAQRCACVDFIREIGAVTLLGNGFGDIIRPAKLKEMFLDCSSFQPNVYYLAASIYDMKNITIRLHGIWENMPYSGAIMFEHNSG
jgi:hypothetical protein